MSAPVFVIRRCVSRFAKRYYMLLCTHCLETTPGPSVRIRMIILATWNDDGIASIAVVVAATTAITTHTIPTTFGFIFGISLGTKTLRNLSSLLPSPACIRKRGMLSCTIPYILSFFYLSSSGLGHVEATTT